MDSPALGIFLYGCFRAFWTLVKLMVEIIHFVGLCALLLAMFGLKQAARYAQAGLAAIASCCAIVITDAILELMVLLEICSLAPRGTTPLQVYLGQQDRATQHNNDEETRRNTQAWRRRRRYSSSDAGNLSDLPRLVRPRARQHAAERQRLWGGPQGRNLPNANVGSTREYSTEARRKEKEKKTGQ